MVWRFYDEILSHFNTPLEIFANENYEGTASSKVIYL